MSIDLMTFETRISELKYKLIRYLLMSLIYFQLFYAQLVTLLLYLHNERVQSWGLILVCQGHMKASNITLK